MGPLDRLVAAAALATLLAAAAMPGNAGSAPAPGFQVYHFASPLQGTGFGEVFLVHDVSPGFAAQKSEVRLLVNGEPIDATWDPGSGPVAVGDSFSFKTFASDRKQVLTGEVEGRQVMRCLFGIGAALGVTPEEWRDLGQPEQVRCLQLLDDQFDPGESQD